MLSTLPHGRSFASSAGSQRPSFSFQDIYVLAAQRMSSLAMRLCALLFGCGCDHKTSVSAMQIASIKQRNFRRYSSFKTLHDHIRSDASLPRPIRRDHTNAHKLDPDVVIPVLVLICPWNPMAIVGRVVSVVVSAIKRITIRARPHIGLEVSEPLTARNADTPAVAYRNSSAAVSMEVWGAGVIASLQHVDVEMIKLFIFPRGSHAVLRW